MLQLLSCGADKVVMFHTAQMVRNFFNIINVLVKSLKSNQIFQVGSVLYTNPGFSTILKKKQKKRLVHPVDFWNN